MVRIHRNLTSAQLSLKMVVSEDTIRRDLNELDKKGLIKKVHGGAVSTIQKLYHYNEDAVFNSENKNIIANKAISLLEDGMVIIMSGGTTNLILAKHLPKNLKATVYTYSLPIALQLTEHADIEIIFIGGKIQKQSMVTIGLDVSNILSDIKADICFMGVSGICINHGITDEGYEVSTIKKRMIACSDKVVSLITSNKIGVRQAYKVCDISNMDVVVTNMEPTTDSLKAYIEEGVTVL